MVDKIIAEYLKTGRRLIVPDLGVFIKREDKDEVVFSTLLTKNDGILLQMIQDRIHMPEEKATIILNHYVQEINNQLDALGKFRIEGFGTIIKRGNDIEFIYSGDKNVGIAYKQRMVESAQTIKTQQQTQYHVQQQTRQTGDLTNTSSMSARNDIQQPESKGTESEQKENKSPINDRQTQPYPAKEIENKQRQVNTTIQKPTIKEPQKKSSKENKADIVLIVAIIAAVIAIIIMIYGATVHHPKEFDLNQQDTEQVFDMATPETQS